MHESPSALTRSPVSPDRMDWSDYYPAYAVDAGGDDDGVEATDASKDATVLHSEPTTARMYAGLRRCVSLHVLRSFSPQ
jgi:hypothetical protein